MRMTAAVVVQRIQYNERTGRATERRPDETTISTEMAEKGNVTNVRLAMKISRARGAVAVRLLLVSRESIVREKSRRPDGAALSPSLKKPETAAVSGRSKSKKERTNALRGCRHFGLFCAVSACACVCGPRAKREQRMCVCLCVCLCGKGPVLISGVASNFCVT